MAVPIVGATGMSAERGGGGGALRAGPATEDPPCATVGTSPHYPAYDPINHDVYVPNLNSNNVSVLKGCKVVATVTLFVGAGPWAAAYDPVNNYVYVTDLSSNALSVLSGTSVVATISCTCFDKPSGILFQPDEFVMLIANAGSDTYSEVSGLSVVSGFGSVTVGSNPVAFVWYVDYGITHLFVADSGSDDFTSISSLGTASIPVGTTPEAMTYDWADQTVYIANYGSDNVTAWYVNYLMVTNIPVGSHPTGIAYDPATQEVFVADQGSSEISVIRGDSVVGTIVGPAGTGFTGLVYNEQTDLVDVTAISTDQVYAYS